jgi:membrane-bound inhibitor of C-type lysozyme
MSYSGAAEIRHCSRAGIAASLRAMLKKPTGTNLLRTMCICLPPLIAASCVSGGTAANTAEDTTAAQPRLATYSCGDAGSLTVENFRTSVHITEPDGASVDLPASPPTQQSRYGEAPYALVLEGNEALLMKNGKEPLTCSR